MIIHIPQSAMIGDELIFTDKDGNQLDRVTDILTDELNLAKGKWLTPYAQRGTDVDTACEFYDDGDLDESSLSEEVKSYVEQYKLSLPHYGIKVLINKLRRYFPDYLITGELDKICKIGEDIWVIDLKTTSKQYPHHKWQTAVYLEMVREELTEKYGKVNFRRGCLYLRPDSFELVEHTEKNNFKEYLALYAARKIKLANGYVKGNRRPKDEENV